MKEIDNIVKKVLLESLDEKANEITKKIKMKMEGAECMEGDCGEMEEGSNFKKALKSAYKKKHPKEKLPASLKNKFFKDDEDDEDETDVMSGEFDYVAEEGDMESQLDEKLFGKQHKIDVAKPKGKITKADFDKLRSKKSETKEAKKFPDLTGDGKVTYADILKGRGVKLKKENMNEKWEGNTQVEKTGEYSDMSVSQINAAIKALKSKTAKLQDEGKKVPKSMREKMSELYFAKRAKQGWKGKGSAKVEESIQYSIKFGENELVLSENEMINMIEEIVLEEKKSNLKSPGKSKGMVEFDRVHKKDEDINKKANQESFKKMRDYVKAGSKGSFEENPKHFPKGNGQLAKMSKKAYTPSDAVDEYIDNFAYGGGMLDLYTDEIGYNEDWLEKTIEGSAMTGNSPEYANAEDTGYGKKLNKRRKEGLYNKEKRQGSYNRVKQPVDVAGENTKSGKLNKMFKGLGESTEKKEILSEEMVRMKELLSYNKNTQ